MLSSVSHPRSLPGHKGPRGAILLELKRARELSAKDLAVKLGISLNAIRHHLKELEAESLVEYHREHRGVGAPVFLYRLSIAGEDLFPRHYQEMLLDVLDQVEEREGRASAVSLLQGRYEKLARRLLPLLEGTPRAHRVAVVTRALVDEGYMAEWQGSDAEGTLIEHNCAIRAVAERFPEQCAAEARFFEEVLGAVVERKAHVLAGCSACEYHVQFPPSATGGSEEKGSLDWNQFATHEE